MGKISQNDLRYNIVSTVPKIRNGVVTLRTKFGNFVLTVLEIDNLWMKVLYKYHTNILGERCVSFEHCIM
jgi:hypothetical protein